MKRLLTPTLLAVLVGAGIAFASVAGAASEEQKAASREKARATWESMTPEEKAAAKDKAKAKWDSMTPEQQAAAKKAFVRRYPAAAASMAERPHAESAAAGK